MIISNNCRYEKIDYYVLCFNWFEASADKIFCLINITGKYKEYVFIFHLTLNHLLHENSRIIDN